MRYLNKVVFINSANIAYAEIEISGNVHFIGTQGVGKSTTLRAILFFYNADKLKLGIEKGKRSFDEYYFPHGNSFIIYEVVTETGNFCVLAYKAQGRVAFRFIDGAYSRTNFISEDHKAMNWEQIRNTFSVGPFYSRKIERYEEYRDILYGNNKGLQAQFRKFALIDSRQYQNLPRTIQNVFLNSKLEAEFIKQTIIMSLNEDDVRIDLEQFALHLKDFEQQLSDIGKWSERTRSGDIVVRLLADKIAKLYTTVRFLEQDRIHLIQSLLDVHAAIEHAYPGLSRALDHEKDKLAGVLRKVEDADQKFQLKKDKINKEITLADAKLAESRRKLEQYERIDIHLIIQRIAKKPDWESKKEHLQAERSLLAARYQEITTKYEAIIIQLQNQLEQFVNAKNNAGNDRKAASYQIRDELRRQYEKIIAGIEQEHAGIKQNAEALLEEKKQFIYQLELRRKEAEFKRWFEKEILTAEHNIAAAKQILLTVETEKVTLKAQIELLQKQWELDTATNEALFASRRRKPEHDMLVLRQRIDQNREIIAASSNSLYEWLHENKPGWEHTIGKVIDQRSVLFNSELFPKNVNQDHNLLYGVELDLSGLASDIKSIPNYEQEIEQFTKNIAEHESFLTRLSEDQTKDAEKLKKKYQPQVKGLKDQIALGEYEKEKAARALEAAILDRDEKQRKAETAQKAAIAAIKQEIVNARQERTDAEGQLQVIQKNIKKQVEDKRKERDHKIEAEVKALALALEGVTSEISDERARIQHRITDVENQSKRALEEDGADVIRISAIEWELIQAAAELDHIEANRDKVVEYRKDKRELFDRVDDLKANKKLAETKLLSEQQRHEAGKAKLKEALTQLKNVIEIQQQEIMEMEQDLQAFDTFSNTQMFQDAVVLASNQVKLTNDGQRLTTLVTTITDRIHESTNRMNDLRASINKFLSHFSRGNIFGFEFNLNEDDDYIRFAERLSEFLEENKIEAYETRTNEFFSNLIVQVGKETTALVSKEATISKVISDINKDFEVRNFTGVIKSINLRLSPSAHKIVTLLQEIRRFNNEFGTTLGGANLFSNNDSAQNNKRAVSYLKSFADEIASSKQSEVTLSDTFELEFRIVENDNDSGWVEKLTNVGSEGTDVLVKAMINIMLLNVFKESASKKFKDFRLHCMMDEIGKLHPNNVKGILKFANDRNIVLINSSPTSYNAVDYKFTYLLSKDSKNSTTIKKLITNNTHHGIKQSLSS